MEWLLVIVALIIATSSTFEARGPEGLRAHRWFMVVRYTAAVLICAIAAVVHAAERGWLR